MSPTCPQAPHPWGNPAPPLAPRSGTHHWPLKGAETASDLHHIQGVTRERAGLEAPSGPLPEFPHPEPSHLSTAWSAPAPSCLTPLSPGLTGRVEVTTAPASQMPPFVGGANAPWVLVSHLVASVLEKQVSTGAKSESGKGRKEAGVPGDTAGTLTPPTH